MCGQRTMGAALFWQAPMFTLSAQYTRLALGTIAFLAFLTFAAYYTAVRPSFAAAPVVSSPAVTTTFTRQADAGSCAGTYVTGDMVGDASPATVYATACNASR
jgi:hypothetical protein